MPNAKPFPLYTDGTAIYTTFDGGATYVTLDSGAAGLNQLTGDVTAGPGSGSQAATIAAAAVTNAKLANMAATTVKGSVGGGVPADLTQAQLTALINPATASLPGAMTAALAATFGGIPGDSLGIAAYATGSVDCTGTNTGTFDMPLAAGKTFRIFRLVMEILSRTGAATGPVAGDIAQNGTSIDGAIGPGTYSFSSANINVLPLADLVNAANIYIAGAMDSFPLQFKISTAVTGSSVMTARFVVYGRYA